ncbi:MAG TPA: preprotein translocase subunit YajC [Microbacteriaceae bacterium]|jgi:preprotein translocase subunit YajC|nr:preprotein translocase subunit YajC [Microbacteriaceae bacterium]HQX35345.1 preprotein translocase subunit YajC [Microbacteriaceae bacterium]HQZ48219.1 preprotein translocase subunit YajC [Microbacteriaceae bacterium]HRA08845.1 preprotein translocase subunit YajC [Microbacteriaceae bacterium]
MDFFAQYGLLIVLALLLVFMFYNQRKRMTKQKAEQETMRRNTVPGAEVLLQGGLYGHIVAYDPDNLDEPALIELAPGVVVRTHSQAILRVVSPLEAEEPSTTSSDAPAIESIDPLNDVIDRENKKSDD